MARATLGSGGFLRNKGTDTNPIKVSCERQSWETHSRQKKKIFRKQNWERRVK